VPTTRPSSGQRTTIDTAQASALAALLTIWTRKKSTARPVYRAINAATATPSRPNSTARGRPPRTSRTTATTTPTSTAAPPAQATGKVQPDASATVNAATNATTGTVASTAAPRPPSRSARPVSTVSFRLPMR
jgi:hypothetical protein